MVETLTVTVTLLEVAVPIEARPGDRLMMLGDKIVGVYTGKPAAAAAPKAATPQPPKKQRRETAPKVKDMRDRLLALLADGAPHAATDVFAALGVEGSNDYRMKAALRTLEQEGRLVREGPYSNRAYRLLPGQQEAA